MTKATSKISLCPGHHIKTAPRETADVTSARVGRSFAWIYGGGALLGGVAAGVLSSGIPSTQPDLGAHYAYVRKIWPELYLSFLLLTAAFLSLIPLAVVLRQRFGSGLRSELVYASFFGAAILGALWMLTQIGSAQAVARDTAGANPQTLAAIGSASSIWSEVVNWLQRGFLLFAGLGSYWTGRAILDLGVLPRRLGWWSLILASFYGLGLLSLLLRDAGLPLPDAIGSLLIVLGSLFATVWALWLGWELGRRFTSRLSE